MFFFLNFLEKKMSYLHFEFFTKLNYKLILKICLKKIGKTLNPFSFRHILKKLIPTPYCKNDSKGNYENNEKYRSPLLLLT